MARVVETMLWGQGAAPAGVWEVVMSPPSWRDSRVRVAPTGYRQGQKDAAGGRDLSKLRQSFLLV